MVKEDTVPREVTATAWVNDAPAKVLNVYTYSQSMTDVGIHLDVFPFSAFSLLVLCSRRNSTDTINSHALKTGMGVRAGGLGTAWEQKKS